MALPGCVPVLPGEVSGDALTAVVVENDLPAAIQLQSPEVKVLYPEERHSFRINLAQAWGPDRGPSHPTN